MPKIDSDTFRGKLYLLVIDKIVIGALIAIVFLIYDQRKTEEIRRYDEARQEVELGFKRAEYVKELVPIAVDADQDVIFRAQALAALVETRSISSESAVSLMQKLLLSDVLAFGRYTVTSVNPINEAIHTHTNSPNTEKDFLLVTMLKVMPSGLPSVLNYYAHTVVQHRNYKGHDIEQRRILNDASGFWIDLFREITSQKDDEELFLLNSEPFVTENLATIHAIVPTLSVTDAEQWTNRKNFGLRTLGFLRLAQSKEKSDLAIPFLKSAINPRPHSYGLDFASELIKLLHQRAVVLPEVSAEILAIVLNRENLKFHRQRPGDERSPIEDHFYVASDYLVWSGQFPQVASAIEQSVISELQTFYNTIKASPVDALEYGTNYPIEWSLVQFLISSRSASKQHASENSQRLLAELFSVGKDKLQRTGLFHYAEKWKDAQR